MARKKEQKEKKEAVSKAKEQEGSALFCNKIPKIAMFWHRCELVSSWAPHSLPLHRGQSNTRMHTRLDREHTCRPWLSSSPALQVVQNHCRNGTWLPIRLFEGAAGKPEASSTAALGVRCRPEHAEVAGAHEPLEFIYPSSWRWWIRCSVHMHAGSAIPSALMLIVRGRRQPAVLEFAVVLSGAMLWRPPPHPRCEVVQRQPCLSSLLGEMAS